MTTTPTTGTPTQVAHPWRAAARTAVQIIVPALVLFVVAQPVVEDQLGGYLPDGWAAWYAAATGFLTALGATAARLMALPAAQRLLEAIGLGTGVHAEGHGRRADRDGVPDGRVTPLAERYSEIDHDVRSCHDQS